MAEALVVATEAADGELDEDDEDIEDDDDLINEDEEIAADLPKEMILGLMMTSHSMSLIRLSF